VIAALLQRDIAEFDLSGFFGTWFSTPSHQLEWVDRVLTWPCYGSPDFTYSDVEREFQAWLRGSELRAQLAAGVAAERETRERAVLARLKAQYEPQTAPDQAA
jgi:hypothetical protein